MWSTYLHHLTDGVGRERWADHVVIQALSDMLELSLTIYNTLTPEYPMTVESRGNSKATLTLGQVSLYASMLISINNFLKLQNFFH